VSEFVCLNEGDFKFQDRSSMAASSQKLDEGLHSDTAVLMSLTLAQ